MTTSYVGPEGDGFRVVEYGDEVEVTFWDTDQVEDDWYLSSEEAYELGTALLEFVSKARKVEE
jgi:hypothetical protein